MLALKRYIITVSQKIDRFCLSYQSRCLISLIGRGEENNKSKCSRFDVGGLVREFLCIYRVCGTDKKRDEEDV